MEQQIQQKKRIFSGIQPTGNLTLGTISARCAISAFCRTSTTACTPLWICTP